MSVGRPRGAVQVNVNGDDGALLLPLLQVQQDLHLASGEGGAGVLPGVVSVCQKFTISNRSSEKLQLQYTVPRAAWAFHCVLQSLEHVVQMAQTAMGL